MLFRLKFNFSFLFVTSTTIHFDTTDCRFWTLFKWNILDQPQVTLQLGSTLNPDDIKEGDDVYFECHIKANPKENRITWWHDVST